MLKFFICLFYDYHEAIQAINNRLTNYTPDPGLPSLRKAVIDKFTYPGTDQVVVSFRSGLFALFTR